LKTAEVLLYEQRTLGVDYMTGKKTYFFVGSIAMSLKVDHRAFASCDSIDYTQPRFSRLDVSQPW
jgi:hypothetical protein